LVAAKAEETYRKIKPILIHACKLLNPAFSGFDENNEVIFLKLLWFHIYWNLKKICSGI
jgi:hypothetical protein